MTWLPAASEEVAKVALPEFNVVVPSVVAPSKKVTVPVGVPDPGATALTVAVNVTDCPRADGFTDDITTVALLFLLLVGGRVKLVTFVPQSAPGLLGSGSASSSANSLIAQKLPSEATLMPLRSPARCVTPNCGPKSS